VWREKLLRLAGERLKASREVAPMRIDPVHRHRGRPFIRHLVSDGWWITGQPINGGYTTN